MLADYVRSSRHPRNCSFTGYHNRQERRYHYCPVLEFFRDYTPNLGRLMQHEENRYFVPAVSNEIHIAPAPVDGVLCATRWFSCKCRNRLHLLGTSYREVVIDHSSQSLGNAVN